MRHLIAAVSLLAAAAATGAAAQIFAEQRLGPASGVALAPRSLAATDDAGASWRDIMPAGARRLDGAAFAARADGWAVIVDANGAPCFARTTDGGRSWSWAPLPLTAADRERYGDQAWIDRLDGARGFVMLRLAGQAGFSHGLLLATSDGGAHWRRLPDPPLGERPVFVSREIGWLAGGPRGNQVFVTRDGAHGWTAVEPPRPASIPPASSVRYELAPHAAAGEVAIIAHYDAPRGATTAILRAAGRGWRAPTLLAAMARAARRRLPPRAARASRASISWMRRTAGR